MSEQIIRLNQQQVTEIFNTYMKEDFPSDELKPLDTLLNLIDQGIYDCLGWYEDGRLRAYACLVRGDKECLLDYLAVCPEYRSGGYGSRFLRAFQELYPDHERIWIECENIACAETPQEKQIRTRRIEFYLRNGVVHTGVGSNLFGVEFTILCLLLNKGKSKELKEAMGREQAASHLDGIYQIFFTKELYDQHVQVWVNEPG